MNLKAKERDLRDIVTQLQEGLTEEQKSFTHITSQQVMSITLHSIAFSYFSFYFILLLLLLLFLNYCFSIDLSLMKSSLIFQFLIFIHIQIINFSHSYFAF